MPDTEPLTLVDLTDEELAAIDASPTDSRIVVYPYLDSLDPRDRDTSIAAALRSLLMRGHIEIRDSAALGQAASQSGGTAEISIRLNDALRRVLALRQSAQRIICVQRTAADRTDFCYIYPMAEEHALIEDVRSEGFHQFRLEQFDGVTGTIAGYVNPAGLVGADGSPRAATLTGSAPNAQMVAAAFGTLTSFSEILIRDRSKPANEPPLIGIFAGSAGLFVSRTRFGSQQPVTIVPVSANTLAAELRRVLDE